MKRPSGPILVALSLALFGCGLPKETPPRRLNADQADLLDPVDEGDSRPVKANEIRANAGFTEPDAAHPTDNAKPSTRPPAKGGPALGTSNASLEGDAAADETRTELRIIDQPIRFDKRREELTLAYRRAHQDPKAQNIEIQPRVIVVHHTGGGSFQRTWNYFNRTTIESARRKVASGGSVNVSAHFLVDRDGRVVRLMPETRMARHTIGLNHIAIGIENVADGKQHPFTTAQVDANIRLIRQLVKRHPITHVIGHHEYRSFEGHPYFIERNPRYRTTKVDPGAKIMAKIRAGLSELTLAGPPQAKP